MRPPLVRRRPAREVNFGQNAAAVAIEASGVGYVGALPEDQARWLAGFRRVLDALESPIQFLLQVRPTQLEGDRIGHARRVWVVAQGDADAIAARLGEMGLSVALVKRPDGVGLLGDQAPRSFRDAAGHHRTWYLERFPGGELEPGWLLRLLPAGVTADLTWHADPMPTGWAVDYLRRQLAQLRAAQLDGDRRGLPDVELNAAVPAAADLQRKLSASQERAFHVGLYLTISAADPAGLESAAARVEEAARGSLCGLHPCTFRHLDGRVATLPLGVDRLRRRHVVDTSALLTLFPWIDAEIDDAGGFAIGNSRATGMPVTVQPFSTAVHENANIAVFGHSGAGKTYLLSTLSLAALEQGCQVFVIDPEHEYGALARAVGGADVQLALGSGHALNVMEARGRGEGWLGPAVADTVELVTVLCGAIDEAEKASLEEAVRKAYAECQEPVLADVADRLPGAGRVGRILGRWTVGALGSIFSAPTNVDLDLPFVAFGMREMREEMIAPVHFLLAEALWRRIRERDRRRLLVVDELGLLFEDATMRRFVVRLARRIRKYDGSLVFATQNPGDLLASDAGLVVATNPAIRFLGAQRPGEAQKLQRAFQLSDAQRQSLEGARRGEFLLAAGHRRLAIDVHAGPAREELMARR